MNTLNKKQGHRGLSTASGLITLIRLLQEEDLSYAEIQEKTGLGNNTVGKYIGLLHRAGANCIYICEWRRDSTRGNPSRVYSWGWLEKDVQKPPPMTQKEYTRRWRLNLIKKGFESGIRENY